MLTRLVRIVNWIILALILTVAGAVYWLTFRPLPKVSGELSAPITAAATVKRDAHGIPHIEASTWQDAIFLQGFVTAQDRLWQMDTLRRFAGGELSEVFGPAALAADQRARALRMGMLADACAERLTPEDRALMVEYARGVNFFIDTHRGNYGLEFSLPGHAYDPRPWKISDSMLIGLIMFRNLTDTMQSELAKGNLASTKGVDHAKLNILFPAAAGEDASPGSNAWAVSGAHTVGGKPMAANDPHLEYGIPGTWHLIHLKAPGLNVSGAALPGVPAVITGHNDQIAWGVTNLETDVMDVYREQIDERTGKYAFQGKTEQARLETQWIAVKDQKPVPLRIWVTRHGPVVHDGDKAYSVRWTPADGFGFPFYRINKAANWQDFRAALTPFWGPPQNFIYADRAGNIGYQATGKIPIRRDFSGDEPLDGASGKFEWDGYIPFEQLPSIYNPPSGIIATANQNPFPPGYPFQITGPFADGYRFRQIHALLAAKGKLSVDDMLAVQKDVYSGYDHFLATQAAAAFAKPGAQPKDGLAPEAVDILRKWNGQMDKESAGAAVSELLSNELRSALVKSVYPKADVTAQPRSFVVETFLRTRPKGWVPKDDWDSWILANLTAALEKGRTKMGTPEANWRWGQLMRWNVQHPVGKQLPMVGGFFNIGPIEMSGSGTTVKQTTLTLGPSERMVADLSDWDHSIQNLPFGESGFVASGHYKDQWEAYYNGKSLPMQFDHVEAKDVLRVTPGH